MIKLDENPIGIYEKAFPNSFSWEEKIKIAKRAGYDYIEISIDESDERLSRLNWSKEQKKSLRRLLEDEDFKILSMCLSGHRKYPFGSHDEAIRIRAMEIMKDAVEFAEDIGIRNIQLAGYDVYYEEQDYQTEEWFIEGLRKAVEIASRANIMLSIEIMDTDYIGTIQKCKKFIDLINSPWLKIYPDLGNLSQWTSCPELELAIGRSDIVAIHLKDTKPGIFKCVPFGEGTVRFRELFKTLKNLKYYGPFMVEMWADNNVSQSADEIEGQIVNAKKWLNERMNDYA